MRKAGSLHHTKLKVARWVFAVAALLFVSKPFIGFAMDPSNPFNESSILVKSFTKRKHEYVENSSFDAKTMQKKLADPCNQLVLVLTALLAIILPGLFDKYLPLRRATILPIADSGRWLSNKQLLI